MGDAADEITDDVTGAIDDIGGDAGDLADGGIDGVADGIGGVGDAGKDATAQIENAEAEALKMKEEGSCGCC